MPYTVASPSPVPFPCSLVVKKGSKSRPFVSASMPWPVSRNGEHDVPPRSQAFVRLRQIFVDIDIRRLDRQLAAVGHRVSGVDDEVDEHLLDLARIGLDAAESTAEDGDHLDVLADQAAEHLVHLADDVVEPEDARLQELLAAEREQLPRERA